MNSEIIKLTFGVVAFTLSVIAVALKIAIKIISALLRISVRFIKRVFRRKKATSNKPVGSGKTTIKKDQAVSISSNAISSSVAIGNQGEKDLLDVLNKTVGDNVTLSNLYIPKVSGNYAETDAVHITPHGIFLIEYKNYNADIYMSDDGEWFRTKKGADKKYSFYSPVKQNLGHKKAIASYLKDHYTGLNGIEKLINPYVVFGNNSDISNVPSKISGCEIINLKDLDDSIFFTSMSSEHNIGIDTRYFLCGELSKLENISDVEKQQHIKRISDIKSRYGCA